MSALDRLQDALEDPSLRPGPWEPYFTGHGDPYVMGRSKHNPEMPGNFAFDIVAEVDKHGGDYGRATATFMGLANPTVVAALVEVARASEFVLRQSAPCDPCYEEGTCTIFCPCDFGCHNGEEAARGALAAAWHRLETLEVAP